MGLIISLLLGGGLGIGGLLSPAGALIHVKEIVFKKFDSISSVVDERSLHIMRSHMFSTNATCKIKIRCRYTGVTEKQMQKIKAAGGKLVDADGKEVSKNSLGRYTGGKKLIIPSETGTKEIDAKNWRSAALKDQDVREFTVRMFAAKRMSFAGRAGKAIRAKFKLTTNPEWGDGSEKDAKKSVYQATSGESVTATADNVPDTEKYETEKNPDGSIKTDANGNPVFKTDANGNRIPTGNDLNMGDAADNINEEADKLRTAAANGEDIADIPSDPGGAAAMEETPVVSKGVLGKTLGFLNPADILVGLCASYKFANTMIIAARTIALANAMRYASQFLSTADKIKAGEATTNDVNQAMTILEKEDQYGDAFGDSVGYQYAAYDTVPDKSVASSAIGNGVVVVMAQVVGWLNNHLGRTVLKKGCGLLSSPITQVGLSLTSFIPGAGQAIKGVTKVISVGVKAVAERTIKQLVKDIVEKTVKKGAETAANKAALKAAAKVASREFKKMAASAAGIFLAGYLTQRYMVPWLARVLSGTDISNNGVSAMDTTANGFDATNSATAQEEGLQPLKKNEDRAFNQFNDAYNNTYVADMRAKSNPFDVMDPYSASNSLASAFYTAASKVKSAGILSTPAAILSSINPSSLFSTNTLAATDNHCEDDYLNKQGLATSPFCNVRYGYADTNMLENTTPEAVVDWMLNHKQIDESGEPVDSSDYAKFLEKCGPGSGGKTITEFDAEGENLDKDCYGNKNQTTEWKYFRLYLIDGNTNEDMDEVPPEDNTSNVKYIAIGNIPVEGMQVGASVFGGKQSGGNWVENLADNGGNDNGNGGAKACNSNDPHLSGTSSFAELDMGKALGNIPDCTKLEIKYKDKTIIAAKMDIGAGGGDVQGHKRAIDLWWEAANALGFNVGTGVVTIHAVDPNTQVSDVSATGNFSKNIGAIFNLGNFNNIFSPLRAG